MVGSETCQQLMEVIMGFTPVYPNHGIFVLRMWIIVKWDG